MARAGGGEMVVWPTALERRHAARHRAFESLRLRNDPRERMRSSGLSLREGEEIRKRTRGIPFSRMGRASRTERSEERRRRASAWEHLSPSALSIFYRRYADAYLQEALWAVYCGDKCFR